MSTTSEWTSPAERDAARKLLRQQITARTDRMLRTNPTARAAMANRGITRDQLVQTTYNNLAREAGLL